MAAHGYPRATVDIDIWVNRARTNAAAIMRALKHFGAPLHDLTAPDLQKERGCTGGAFGVMLGAGV